MKAVLLTLLGLLLATVLGAALFIASGIYDISANVQHTQAVYTLLEETMHRSVKRRAAQIAVPPLDAPALLARGAVCFRDTCQHCHGGPGQAQDNFALSLQPLPGPLVDARQRWEPAELYWIVRNGIKMSGMPAWQHRLPDADLWALVGFMQRLPLLTAAEYQRLAGPQADGDCSGAVLAQSGAPGDGVGGSAAVARASSAERGRNTLTQYACNACHNIPGVTGSRVHVGTPLAGLASRGLIAGVLPNTPENLLRWITDPRSVDPETTMPALPINDADARDMVAYLGTLR